MGYIPALSTEQIRKLGQLLNSQPSSNQVPPSNNSSRKTPVYYEDETQDASFFLAKIASWDKDTGIGYATLLPNGVTGDVGDGVSFSVADLVLAGEIKAGGYIILYKFSGIETAYSTTR